MTDAMQYAERIDAAMRGMVRDVLRQVERDGLPDEHHFYLSFRTDGAGVSVSDTLTARFPDEMTIVLQHQFWDFKVLPDHFEVTLSFSGVPEHLVVPYKALTAFADPSVKFGLQFHQEAVEDMEDGQPSLPAPLAFEEVDGFDEEDDAPDAPAEIISLDAFRKK